MQQRQLISFDWALKRLLRSEANFDILEGFLSELLRDNVRIQEILENASRPEDRLDKYSRVDLHVKNSRDELIRIELQYEREFDCLQRILAEISKTITGYSGVPKVISISILYFDLGQGDDYIYHKATIFRGIHTNDELGLSERQQEMFFRGTIQERLPEYYLLKVNRFNDVVRDPLDEWIHFLKNQEIRDDFTARGLIKAKEEFALLKLPEPERQAYERYQDDLRDQARMVESAYGIGKREGERTGRQEGIQIGEQTGGAKMLTRQLQCRFGALPGWAGEQIATAAPNVLAEWSLRILDAQSLEAVFEERR